MKTTVKTLLVALTLTVTLNNCALLLLQEPEGDPEEVALTMAILASSPQVPTACHSGTVPDFCAAAEAEFGCSVYEGMDARLDGGFAETIINQTLEFSAECRGYKYNGAYAGAYTISGNNVLLGSEVYEIIQINGYLKYLKRTSDDSVFSKD